MKLLSGRSSRAVVVAAIIVALGAAGVAVAASTRTSTTVNACYAKKGGDLRRVESSSACKASEVALAWNKRGPAGPRGPKGVAGPAGSARAYAAVSADATLVAARSKNISSVEDFGPGDYCVFLDPSIDVSTVVSIASLDGNPGSADGAVYTKAGGCSVGDGRDSVSGILVETRTMAGAVTPMAFSLMVP